MGVYILVDYRSQDILLTEKSSHRPRIGSI